MSSNTLKCHGGLKTLTDKMSSTKITFISLIDPQDGPLIVFPTLPTVENELKSNVMTNTSLDWFQSDLYNAMGVPGMKDIKQLFELEGWKVYGQLVKQTGMKFVLGFDADVQDDEVIAWFEKIRKLTVKCRCNPFVNSQDNLVDVLKKTFKREFGHDSNSKEGSV
ncbi:HEL106Wp [Eremothecium sinecaudum]|uniref:HEL106Wp n=1 Tax=Eremothecium sinecaudum TaxID=45286 RepID=A0A0X8HTI4_9SACH|nr:HEL106Wp [Eremothecium sinecaudum]AMD21174.1 HEL106Wp [Eremothecium sinecaudum]